MSHLQPKKLPQTVRALSLYSPVLMTCGRIINSILLDPYLLKIPYYENSTRKKSKDNLTLDSPNKI
jgi:hypothetical protein